MHPVILLRELADNWNYLIRKFRHRVVSKVAQSVLTNLDIINGIEAAKQSAQFERENLLATPIFKKRKQLFAHGIDMSPSGGLLMEFGTYKGDSINQMAKLYPTLQFYAFDSFEGLPEGWTPGARKGAFTTQGNLPHVRKNVSIVPGFYDVTLKPFLERHVDTKVSFIHIDCDLYSSTKTVLESFYPRLVIGTVIVFDEFYNYPGWVEGEFKAWIEFCEKYSVEFDYIGYIRLGWQVGVKITKI